MTKEIKFRAGKKKQHDSLYKAHMLNLDEVQENEFRFFISRARESIKNDSNWLESELENHLYWLNGILSEKGINCREDISDNDGNIPDAKLIEAGALALAAMHTKRFMRNAYNSVRKTDNPESKGHHFENACLNLLRAIPSLLVVQELLNEDEILAGRSRSEGGNKEKTRIKEERIELCKPLFYTHISKGHRKKRASELTAKQLLEKHDLAVRPETIRGWFKGKE